MTDSPYFFDTYAFFEIIDGNPRYDKYLHSEIMTTKWNLFELYYGLLISVGQEIADKKYEFYLQFCIDVDDDAFKEAAQFKAMNKKKNLSYADCLGYVLARKAGIKFLTGDKQFEVLDGVEFVR